MAIINTKNGTTQLSDVGTYRNNIRKATGRKIGKGKSTNINTSMDENKLAFDQLTGFIKSVAPRTLVPAIATAATGGSQMAGVIAANAMNLKLRIDADRLRELMELSQYLSFGNRIRKCLEKLDFSDYNLSPEALSAFRNLTIWKNKLELAKYNLKLAKASNNPVQMQASLSLIDLAKLLIAKYLNMYNQLKVK